MTERRSTACPRCAAAVPSLARTCPQCGTDVLLLHAFQDMQQDLQQVGAHVTTLQTQLSTLQEKFTSVAALLESSAADRDSAAPVAPGVLEPQPESLLWCLCPRRAALRLLCRQHQTVHQGTPKCRLASAGCSSAALL